MRSIVSETLPGDSLSFTTLNDRWGFAVWGEEVYYLVEGIEVGGQVRLMDMGIDR